jgi:cell filamentation protein
LPPDPYVYPGTGCLRNLAGIRDPAELEHFEAEQTSIILAQIQREPVPGRYDLAHLRAFHRRIFGDIYEWAGELRTVAIAKEDSLFALPEHLEAYLTQVLAQLASEYFLRGLESDAFVDRLTHYYAELNAAHPFRDGNGRTQRAFLGQLAKETGYRVAWDRLDGERNIVASRASLRGDNAPLRRMLEPLVEPVGEGDIRDLPDTLPLEPGAEPPSSVRDRP